MIELVRTDSEHEGFRALVAELDADLAKRDGQDNAFYAQFNKINMIKHCLVAYEEKQPVGCGALKQYSPGVMEIKRMYTKPALRGKGIASAILSGLQLWAKEMGYTKCILETGKRQPEAISLYLGSGFTIIPNYGQYQQVENSVCMEKMVQL